MLRSARNYDRNAVSLATGEHNTALDPETGEIAPVPSRAQQHHKDECDINTIVRRFGLTGNMPQAGFKPPLEGDFTNVSDYFTAVRVVQEAGDAFAKLPAEQRERFQNNAGHMLAFLNNPANRDEAIKLGMIPRPPEKTRDAVQAIDELAATLKPK